MDTYGMATSRMAAPWMAASRMAVPWMAALWMAASRKAASWMAASRMAASSFSLNKTPLGETGCLSNPYFLLTGSSIIQFFNSSPFPTQSVRLSLVTYPSLCSTCLTYRALCHAIGHQVFPTQPLPREVEDFPRGDKYFKHVPPPTYLIYFSPKRYT